MTDPAPNAKPTLQIPRIVTHGNVEAVSAARGMTHLKWGEAATMLAALLAIPRELAFQADALAAICGHGHRERVCGAIRVWQRRGVFARYLLVAGTYHKERTFDPLSITRLQQPPYWLWRTLGVHTQVHAAITPEQTDWIAARVKDLGITSLALFSSQYHLLRPYLTLLRSLEKVGVHIPIVPVAAIVPPHRPIPEEPEATAYELAMGEAIRIATYPAEDVAGLAEFRASLELLYEWPPMQALRDDLPLL